MVGPSRAVVLTSILKNLNQEDVFMTVSREQELWAMALWVDREHGDQGERFIAERVLFFDAQSDAGGKQLWMDVARRYVELRMSTSAAPN